jgi:hypothetical protein
VSCGAGNLSQHSGVDRAAIPRKSIGCHHAIDLAAGNEGHFAAAALPPCTSSASFLTASQRVATVNGSITLEPKRPRV